MTQIERNERGRKDSRKVHEIIIHDGWDPYNISFNHDIALILLELPVGFSALIQPICLFTKNYENKTGGKVAAWGAIDDEGTIPDVANIAEFKIVKPFQCVLKSPLLTHIAWKKSFCAESETSEVCQGDSGSGFYIEINDKFYLRGIVSSSLATACTKKHFTLFSDVAKYHSFIMVR